MDETEPVAAARGFAAGADFGFLSGRAVRAAALAFDALYCLFLPAVLLSSSSESDSSIGCSCDDPSMEAMVIALYFSRLWVCVTRVLCCLSRFARASWCSFLVKREGCLLQARGGRRAMYLYSAVAFYVKCAVTDVTALLYRAVNLL